MDEEMTRKKKEGKETKKLETMQLVLARNSWHNEDQGNRGRTFSFLLPKASVLIYVIYDSHRVVSSLSSLLPCILSILRVFKVPIV